MRAGQQESELPDARQLCQQLGLGMETSKMGKMEPFGDDWPITAAPASENSAKSGLGDDLHSQAMSVRLPKDE